MEFTSLYRRYRPRCFADMKGQGHVVAALQNAIRQNRVFHSYLLSGPRGTGKTTAARILAKALNCEHIQDGEPCCKCDSCLSIDKGTSFDLHELDAASNNKVDDIRDLLSKVALGTPGRTKVYLLDEVHMLTSGAENALLKTLEEPPDHVVFVMATTDFRTCVNIPSLATAPATAAGGAPPLNAVDVTFTVVPSDASVARVPSANFRPLRLRVASPV